MKISGFTFIKNGLNLGYPIAESIKSIEPLCDEVVINVGFNDPQLTKDDGTYEYLRDNCVGPKYIFLKNYWDPSLTKDGLILSQQTNLAIAACRYDIGQYIQGDELIHEEDLSIIESDIKALWDNPIAMGLIFQYIHFYGNINIIKHTRNMYRREIRTIKLGRGVKSWKDAQGFRNEDDSKLRALMTKARIFHYGWARQEKIMDLKIQTMDKLYHGKDKEHTKFIYKRQWGMKPFTNAHPQLMDEWIKKNNNQLDDIFKQKMEFPIKNVGVAFCDIIEKYTNYRIGEYKNYKII